MIIQDAQIYRVQGTSAELDSKIRPQFLAFNTQSNRLQYSSSGLSWVTFKNAEETEQQLQTLENLIDVSTSYIPLSGGTTTGILVLSGTIPLKIPDNGLGSPFQDGDIMNYGGLKAKFPSLTIISSAANSYESGAYFSLTNSLMFPNNKWTTQLASSGLDFWFYAGLSPIKRANISNTNGVITGGGFKTYSGTSAEFLKADGSVDSTSYLPLSGGTLTGQLKGTSISASGNISASSNIYWNGGSWGSYTGGVGYSMLYPSNVSASNSNYMFGYKKDGTVSYMNSTSDVNFQINDVNVVKVTSGGMTSTGTVSAPSLSSSNGKSTGILSYTSQGYYAATNNDVWSDISNFTNGIVANSCYRAHIAGNVGTGGTCSFRFIIGNITSPQIDLSSNGNYNIELYVDTNSQASNQNISYVISLGSNLVKTGFVNMSTMTMLSSNAIRIQGMTSTATQELGSYLNTLEKLI